MLAVFCFFLHATAGLTIQSMLLPKVSCLSFARLRPSYALDPHFSDPVVITEVASIALLNRWTKFRQYSTNAVKIKTQNVEWTRLLAKLASKQSHNISPSSTFVFTFTFALRLLNFSSKPRCDICTVPEVTCHRCILLIASVQWLDRRKNG